MESIGVWRYNFENMNPEWLKSFAIFVASLQLLQPLFQHRSHSYDLPC